MIKKLLNSLDEVMILATLAKIKYDSTIELNESDIQVIEAIKRSTNDLDASATLEQIQAYINQYNENSLQGLVSNIKGILHEIKFTTLENSDGDHIVASMFSDTNHETFDVRLFDLENNTFQDIQLKATDNQSYVAEWIQENGDAIVVTEEIAKKMGLLSSGFSNQELTIDVNDFITKMQTFDEMDTLWTYMPSLSAISIAIIIAHLWQKFKQNEISEKEFQHYSMYFIANKLAKFTLYSILLSIPVLNVLTVVTIILNFIQSIKYTNETPKTYQKMDDYARINFVR